MTAITLDYVRYLADRLSDADKMRLIDHLTTQRTKEAVSTKKQESSLGQRLRAIRATIVANGIPLLDQTSLTSEILERRGEK